MMSMAVAKSTECPLVQAAWPKAIDKCVLPNPTLPIITTLLHVAMKSRRNRFWICRRLIFWPAPLEVNPTIGVKLLKGKNDKDGFHTWTNEEITCFEKRWPIGTRERLALDLLLYTGLARGDVVRLGRQDR